MYYMSNQQEVTTIIIRNIETYTVKEISEGESSNEK